MSDREPGLENENDPFPEAGGSTPAPEPAPAVPGPPPEPPPAPVEATAIPPVPSAPAPPGYPAYSAYSAYPPPAPAPVPAPGPRVAYAGFWIRFVAWFLDALLLWVLNVGAHSVIRLSAGFPVFPIWTWKNTLPMSLNCAEGLVGLVLSWLYYALFESSAARGTPGKQALSLRVTDLYGRRISFARATGRFFARIVSWITLGIGFVMIAFTGRRQGLHDLIAETVVLKEYR